MFPLPLTITLLFPILLYTTVSTLLYAFLPLTALTATALSALLTVPILTCMYLHTPTPFLPPGRSRPTPQLPAAGVPSLPPVLLLGPAACIAINNVIVLTGLPALFPSYQAVSAELYAPPVPVQLLCTGLFIPAAEELIFRGLFYAPLRTRLSALPSALLSALVFALYHGNMLQGIYAFALALIIIWVYEQTKTILAPFALHAAANVTSIVVTNSGLSIVSDTNHRYITAAAAILSAAISVLCIKSIRRITKNKEDQQ